MSRTLRDLKNDYRMHLAEKEIWQRFVLPRRRRPTKELPPHLKALWIDAVALLLKNSSNPPDVFLGEASLDSRRPERRYPVVIDRLEWRLNQDLLCYLAEQFPGLAPEHLEAGFRLLAHPDLSEEASNAVEVLLAGCAAREEA
jgi:hypothetical protein